MVKEEIKLLLKCKKKIGGGQGCCEPRIEVIVKFEEKSLGGCEQRIEVIVKMQKKVRMVGVGVGPGVGVGWGSGGCKPRIEGIVKWLV